MPQTLEAVFYRGTQDRCDYTPSGSSPAVGKIIDIGLIAGVVTSPLGLSDGVLGSLAISGVFKVKKASGTGVTFAQATQVYWDTVNLTAVASAGANIIKLGLADEAAVSADDHVKTNLNAVQAQ